MAVLSTLMLVGMVSRMMTGPFHLGSVPFPPGTSAQRAELIALTQALIMGTVLAVNIYMDRQYAFETAQVHGAIYQERGLLTSEGKTIKNKDKIL